MFFGVFGRFWSVSDLGFGPGNNPRRQVFEETGTWRLRYSIGTQKIPLDIPTYSNGKIRKNPITAWSFAKVATAVDIAAQEEEVFDQFLKTKKGNSMDQL